MSEQSGRLVRIILTILIALAPLVYGATIFFPSVVSRALFVMSMVEILLLVTAVMFVRKRRLSISWDIIAIALLTFVLVKIVTAVIGQNPTFSFWSSFLRMTGVVLWLHLIALFFLLIAFVRERVHWHNLFLGLVLTSIPMSVFYWLARYVGLSFLSELRGGSLLGNSTYLGVYFLFIFAVCAYLFFPDKRRFVRPLCAIVFLYQIPLLFLSNANASWWAFEGGIVLALALWFLFKSKRVRSHVLIGRGIIAVLVGLFLTLSVLVFQPDSMLRDRFIDTTSASRFVLWKIAWQGFLEHPVFGWGPENYQEVYIRHFDPCLVTEFCGGEVWFDRAHNALMDVLVESGTVGLVSYLWLLGACAFVLFRSRRQDQDSFWAFVFFGTFLTAHFIVNLSMFDNVTSLVFLTVLFAFATSNDAQSVRVDIPLRLRPLGFVFIVGLPVAFLFCVVRPWTTNTAVKRIQLVQGHERTAVIEKVAYGTPIGYAFTREYLAGTLRRSLEGFTASSASFPPDSIGIVVENLGRDVGVVERALRDSIDHSPGYLRSYLALSDLLVARFDAFGNEQDLIEAGRVLARAREISPINQQIYFEEASILVRKNRLEEALEVSEQALALAPTFINAHRQVIAIVALMRDETLAREKIERARALVPSFDLLAPDLVGSMQ